MITWFLTNSLLSALALLFIHTNTSSPHRLRFLVSFLALCCWLVPWQQFSVSALLPDRWGLDWGLDSLSPSLQNAVPFQQYYFEIAYSREANLGVGPAELGMLFLLVTAIPGLLLFIRETWRQRRTLNDLAADARPADYLMDRLGDHCARVPVFIQQRIPGAFTSGLRHPVIWVHESLASSPDLPAILLHESAHIRYHDNLFLVIITFVEKLFWWNPLARTLAARTRALQELSCDEYCTLRLHDYREMLAALILGDLYRETDTRTPALAANMFTKKNADVERIRLMERRYSMKPRHLISTAVTLGAALFSIAMFADEQDDNAFGKPAEAIYIRGENGVAAVNPEIARRNAMKVLKQELYNTGQITEAQLQDDDFQPVETATLTTTKTAFRDFTWFNGGEAGPKLTLKMNVGKAGPTLTVKMIDVPLLDLLQPLAFSLSVPKPEDVAMENKIIAGRITVATGVGPEHIDTPGTGDVVIDEDRHVIFAAAAPVLDLEESVIVEDSRAYDIRVSIDAKNKTVEELVDIVAAEANCNIFIDGDQIVVDYCG